VFSRLAHSLLAILLVLLVGLGCGTADSPTDPGNPPDPGPGPIPPPADDAVVLATGRLTLPAATTAGSSGDHEAFGITFRLDPDDEATAGQRLIFVLRDLTRPAQFCGSPEPEDGCATIDWSDDPGKINVPPSGRFENRLTLDLVTGARNFYPSLTGALALVPDLIDPTRRHTAIAGLGTSWEASLPADLVPGTDLRMRLILTKWLDPSVEIGYELRVEP
jgi:hypothetical protein